MRARLQSAMVVDDDPDDLEFTRRRLERSGRFDKVLTASDGSEAVAAFRRHEDGQPIEAGFPPLLMLLDINMPGLDGFGVLETMASMRATKLPHIVVMLSSSDALEDRERAAQYEIVADYIVKPLSRAMAQQLADRVADIE